MDRRRTAGIALLALAFILWGAMGTAAQFLFALDAGFTPACLVAMRQLAAGVLFLTVAGIARPGSIFGVLRDRTMMIGIAASGALLFGAHLTFFEAIRASNAGTGAVLLTTVPLFVCLWLAFRLRRPVSGREIICMTLAAAGVFLIITDGTPADLRFSPAAV